MTARQEHVRDVLAESIFRTGVVMASHSAEADKVIESLNAKGYRIAGTFIDSGLQYCTTHQGVIDCDEDVCDFYDDPEGEAECAPTPLLYVRSPA